MFAERFPLTVQGATAEDDDVMFERSVRLLCRGIATLIPGG